MDHALQTRHPIGAGLLRWSAINNDAPSTAAGSQLHASDLLQGLPPLGHSHEPREAITHKLKSLINSHGYGEAFEAAIQHVSQQGISELDRVQSLDQFYFWLDAMATWIPELRVWGWDGGTDHERTDDLRITPLYCYFNQPQLLALQSPIDPRSDGSLTPHSAWLREYVISYGRF